MTWDGKERRKNKEMENAILEERLNNFITQSEIFREDLKGQVKEITDKINSIVSSVPCRERIAECKTKFSNFDRCIKWIGIIGSGLIVGVMLMIFKK